jgi:hypothetical protein
MAVSKSCWGTARPPADGRGRATSCRAFASTHPHRAQRRPARQAQGSRWPPRRAHDLTTAMAWGWHAPCSASEKKYENV